MILIIGAGIAGLTTAYELLKCGKKPLVLEMRKRFAGETSRTSAHISNALDDRYTKLIRMHGFEKAKLAAESHTRAIDRIEEICRSEGIDCEFQRLPGYLIGNVKDEYEAARACGLDVSLEGDILKFPRQATFHPIKFMIGLANVITRMGGKIAMNTQVQGIDEGVVHTCYGDISAQWIIQTTNMPIKAPASFISKLIPYRTFVLTANVQYETCLLWDTDDPYHYVRIVDNKMLIGGEDERIGCVLSNVEHVGKFKNLEDWARCLWPDIEITGGWTGQIIEPIDYLSYSGKLPGSENILVHTADSGNGLTSAVIGATILKDIVMGQASPYAELYDPSRATPFSLTSGSKYLRYLGGSDMDIEDIRPCSGAVVLEGFKYKAVYRDKDGVLHKMSAICPHMKGIVKWNDYEKSWDCPVHGSRFTPYGDVLNAPASVMLEKE